MTPVEVSKDFDVEKMGYVKIVEGMEIEIDDSLIFGEVNVTQRYTYSR